MREQDALIVISLPASVSTAITRQQDTDLWETLDDLLRGSLLGQVTGYTTGEGHHEIQILADLVSFEAAWELIRAMLARHGLLGAVTVHLVTYDQDRQLLWPPP